MHKVTQLLDGWRKADPRKSGSKPALQLHKGPRAGSSDSTASALSAPHSPAESTAPPPPRGGGPRTTKGRARAGKPARVPQNAQPGSRQAARGWWAASSSLRCRNSPLRDSLAGRGGSVEPRGRLRVSARPPEAAPRVPPRGRAPRGPRLAPGGTPGPAPAASALGGGVLPQPPSFPGEEQRIAQASGSGGGGGRKGERRKRDLNERR